MKKLEGKNMGGLKIAIEWSKKSRHYDERQAAERPHARENRRDERCYNCDRTGHYARDCRQQRRKDDGGKRDGRGRMHSRSRSFTPPSNRRRYRDDSRSRSPPRDRKRRSPPRRRDDRRDRSPERSRYRRSPSGSRSRSPRDQRRDDSYNRQSDRRTNSPRGGRVEKMRSVDEMREDPEVQ